MKPYANVITSIRIAASIFLLCCEPFGKSFFVVYALCGFSDMIDGTVARITHSASKGGAILDSVADIAFISTAL